MLCPSCGTDVGTSIKLCDACEAARVAREEAARKAEEALAPPPPEPKAEKASPQGKKKEETAAEEASLRRTLILCGVLFAVVIVFMVALFLFKRSKDAAPAPTPISTAPAQPVAPRMTSVGHTRSGVKFGDAEIQLPFNVALYDASARRIDIAYFKNLSEPVEPAEIAASGSLESVNGSHADAILSIFLKSGSTECNMTSVASYQLTVYRGDNKTFPFESDKLTFTIRDVVHDPDASGANLSFDSLSCGFEDGSKVAASFSGRKKIAVKDENLPLSWDLQANSLVIVTSDQLKAPVSAATSAPVAAPEESHAAPYGRVSADTVSVDIKSAVALYYPAVGNVGIGLFADQLTQEDIDQIKRRKSLANAVNGKRASMVIFLDFGSETPNASKDTLQSYTVYFYRDPGGAFGFPGSLDAVSIKRTKEQIQPGDVIDLSGSLLPLGKLNVQMRGEGSASGNAAKFKWHLHYEIVPNTVQ
ncbi:MAG: hypothetical protein U0136_15675 [Bdellovibrionota bacterium]